MAALADRLPPFLRTRFARDAALLQIAALVNVVASLGTSFVLFRSLGPVGYGTYNEALSLYTLLYFLGNVGFSQITIARVAEALGRGEPGAVTRWLGFFTKAYSAFSLALLAGGFAAAPWLGEWILGERETGWWAAVLCLSGPISMPFFLVQCALQGTRRMRPLAEMENLKELLRAYLMIGFTVAVGDARGAILGEVAASLVSIPLAWAAYWKGYAEPGVALPRLSEVLRAARATRWSEVGDLARQGVLLSVNKNFQALMPTVLPRLLLGHYATSREVGYLSLAQNLMKLPLLGLQGVSRTLMPVLGQLRGAGAEERLHKFLVRVMVGSGGIIGAGSALFGVFLAWFIPIFYGEAARPAIPLLPWLFVAMLIAGFAVGVEAFFLVLDKLRIAIRISVVSVVVSIPPGLWMIREYHASGAAAYIALVHGSAAASIVYILWHVKRTGREQLRREIDAGSRGEPR